MGLIYLDSCLLIYLVEDDPVFGGVVRQKIARAAESGSATLAISPLVRLECFVGPMKSGDRALRLRYERAMALLHLLEMPPEVYDGAAELRPAPRVRPASQRPSTVDQRQPAHASVTRYGRRAVKALSDWATRDDLGIGDRLGTQKASRLVALRF